MKTFTFFENEQGSLTVGYDVNGDDDTIICVERSKKNAVEVCQRLNDIVNNLNKAAVMQRSEQLPPSEQYTDTEADGFVFCGKCGKMK